MSVICGNSTERKAKAYGLNRGGSVKSDLEARTREEPHEESQQKLTTSSRPSKEAKQKMLRLKGKEKIEPPTANPSPDTVESVKADSTRTHAKRTAEGDNQGRGRE